MANLSFPSVLLLPSFLILGIETLFPFVLEDFFGNCIVELLRFFAEIYVFSSYYCRRASGERGKGLVVLRRLLGPAHVSFLLILSVHKRTRKARGFHSQYQFCFIMTMHT